jgi:hypothetical protein
MPNWEETFASWAKGPAQTEREKCENAEAAIRKAIGADARLSSIDITVFAQGSYRNRTNVRQESDVDVCVRLNSTFFADYPAGTRREDFGNVDGSITFAEYRNLVGRALVSYFGSAHVTRGDKAFNIHENTYRIDSDVVAAMELRRYTGRLQGGAHHYHSGIRFYSDKGAKVSNWPNQNYESGAEKHVATGRRFKKVIRILKRLRNKMQEDGIKDADNIASCLIEALVWNVPNDHFGHDTLPQDVRAVLIYTFNNTKRQEDCADWTEVNGLHYLLRGGQPWTREQANGFILAAWNYLGFK